MSEPNENLSYKRTTLYQSEFFEVVSVEWTDKSISPLHAHGWSECSVLIEEGVFEDSMELGFKKEIRILEMRQGFYTPVGAHHEFRCLSPNGKTLHVYTPKMNDRSLSDRFSSDFSESLKRDLHLSEPTRLDNLQKILGAVRDQSISTRSPYFMNQLFSGTSPQMLLAESLIAQTKTTMATFEASPVLSTVETEVIEALGEKIGWPTGSRDGVSVPGGSAANFMALHCARQKKFPEFKKKGMNGQKFKVFVSEDAHYSFQKAVVALGFGSDSLVSVPVDQSGRMKVSELTRLLEESDATPLMVCATAGTTVRGAFDPIEELAALCKQKGIWLHVDAAWGGPALFSKKISSLVLGIAQADSVTFDAHKLFGANLTSSFILTRHSGLLLEANDVSGGDYLFHSDSKVFDRGKASWQCGRKADALSFWTIWKSVGTEGLGQFVDYLISVRNETLDWIKGEPRLELVSTPEYLNVCVRVKSLVGESGKDWSQKVREELKSKNLAMVNYSADANGSFLRLILTHPHLEFKHVRQILEWALEVR
jgi:glutamate/tyrosine decarboxylase-like PLP-dependent enzyme